MAKLFNLARMTTATVGTGTITLGAAVSGFLTFANAGVSNSDVVSYGIRDGANSEVGTGTYTTAGTTLTRTVTKSTNANAAISLSGTAEVFITARAEDILNLDAWVTYTPTVTAQTGAITSYTVNSARFKTEGKTIHVEFDITITANGTGATYLIVTAPVTSASFNYVLAGRELVGTGKAVIAHIGSGPGPTTSTFLLSFFDNTYPGATNNRVIVSGTYEAP